MASYPLKCYSGVSEDDFSGWYAVQDTRKCNDFCFWKQSDEFYYDVKNNENTNQTDDDDDDNSDHRRKKRSIADPHQNTFIQESNAKWVCFLGGASEEVMFDVIFNDDFNEKKNVKVFYDEGILQFDFLRCSRGAGETLYSNGQIVFGSITFWAIIMIVSIILLVIQIIYLILWRKKHNRKDTFRGILNGHRNELQLDVIMHSNGDSGFLNDGPLPTMEPTIHAENTTNNEIQTTQSKERKTTIPCSKRTCLITFLLLFDMLLIYILFTAILVIAEIDQQLDLPYSLQVLTPSCSNTQLLCSAANNPIDKPSKPVNNIQQPFSYMIASDSQLNWYNGESAYIGMMNYPPPCSSRDTCGSCTKKLGIYTNQQIKKSIEKLIHMKKGDDVEIGNHTNMPIPKTLIMNGDLTQYFHRHERIEYESIYHNIEGLEQYFPSLGNHDYDQYSGATYNSDEWIGPNYCNGKHAVSYIKGAFCEKIPKFDGKERLTRYDPKSLSYSWEEGSYHFVLVHYYPTYENAGLGISSSVEWLTRDLQLANQQNLTSVLFVHASSRLPNILDEILLDNNVAVIFTGHLHRCLGKKCELVRGMSSYQAELYFNATINNSSSIYEDVGPCFPSSAMLCSTNAAGNGMFYLNDMNQSLNLPNRKLISWTPVQRGVCPVSRHGAFLNETENTALCRRLSVKPYFPWNNRMDNRSIPIFWSGSASYETFLVANFYKDRIVINVMTASEGNEGDRYIDVHSVPNAIYPFHQKSDLEEQTIFL